MTKVTSKPRKRRPAMGSLTARPLKLWVDDSSAQEVRIEIIPLIDVIFCILTFFILAAVGVSRQQAINLDLPKATTGVAQTRELLIVVVDDLGRVFVEDQLLTTSEELSDRVEQYLLEKPQGLMALYASKSASYENVIKVLDALREVGGNRVALATLPEGTELPTNANPPVTRDTDLSNPLPRGLNNPIPGSSPVNPPQQNPLLPGLPNR